MFILVLKIGSSRPCTTSPPYLLCRLRIKLSYPGSFDMRLSRVSTDKHDQHFDLIILPIVEKPYSQHAVDTGKMSRISTNIRTLENLLPW